MENTPPRRRNTIRVNSVTQFVGSAECPPISTPEHGGHGRPAQAHRCLVRSRTWWAYGLPENVWSVVSLRSRGADRRRDLTETLGGDHEATLQQILVVVHEIGEPPRQHCH